MTYDLQKSQETRDLHLSILGLFFQEVKYGVKHSQMTTYRRDLEFYGTAQTDRPAGPSATKCPPQNVSGQSATPNHPLLQRCYSKQHCIDSRLGIEWVHQQQQR